MPKDEKYSAIRSHRTLNSGMQLFQGARNVMINGGSIRQVEEIHYDGGKDAGLHILGQHIATDAMYNSAERFPPAKCHPGTREKIISTILGWVNDPTPKEWALWLNGPAGAGKSAIAHSVAVLLQEISDDSKYAGSFFFAKDVIGRGDGTKLFPTIAYQLALKFPSFRAQIDAAMLGNPTLPTKSIDIQLQYLIIEPLLRVNDWPAHNPTVIIDGLDECAGSKRMQSEILSLISKAIIEHNIPIRFLIVSRPEYWISDLFEIGPLVHITKPLCLRDDEDADRDIERYLREGFNKIYEENIQIMSSTPRPWPPDHIIRRFVYSASGQYIYASTVLEFVGASSNFCDSREQLRILTTPGPHYASAFSDLDKLYATILSSYPRPNTMKRVLGGLLLGFRKKPIQEMLGVDSGEIQLVLRALRSLIKISKAEYSEEFRVLEPIFGAPLVEASISFSHLSFREFLEDESRSGEYAIDKRAVQNEFICAVLKLGVDIVQDNPRAEQTIERIGLSIYRDMLNGLQYLSMRIGLDVRSIANVLEELCESLRKIIACKPSHVAQASHLYWFTTSVLNFLNDMELMPVLDDQYWRKKHRHLLQSLIDVLTIAQKISAQQIMDRSPKNSATFAYITFYSSYSAPDFHHSIKDISEVMNIGLDTIISDLQHLPDSVYFNFPHSDRGYLGYINTGPVFSAVRHKVQGQCQENQHVVAWDPQIINISAHHFDRIYRRNDDQLLVPPPWEFVRTAKCFLRYSRISDIHSKEYFEDPRKIQIFNIIMDTSFWDSVYGNTSIDLVLGALGWFNRQMTEPSKDIIKDHDSRLPRKMLSVAKQIFEIGYFPYFTDPYYSKLWMISDTNEIPSVSLHITPPPHDGPYSIVEERDLNQWELPIAGFNALDFHLWITEFHEQVFDRERSSVISPYDWYPHLSSFLLTALVKNQYAALNANFEEDWKRITKKFFLPFIKCLPYAIPTQHNLNALRALHYLFPKIHPRYQWRPPFGFCSLAIDFLKKYDRSSLSPPEFGSLKDWLSGLRTRESRRILRGHIGSYRYLYDTFDVYTTDEGES
ncbi:hypothetical protein CVT25_004664 [Psilocybe cyanescens]|uniref:Nephrocystin 3-like N-terminal domain-containing protein n=1 Tax=Psilocybe cyanescens TaxID=93625 RepID=A0A409XIV8_PSICY|nr:hypothetical protein CVT25_004664 [Psilocybe cyanescens]